MWMCDRFGLKRFTARFARSGGIPWTVQRLLALLGIALLLMGPGPRAGRPHPLAAQAQSQEIPISGGGQVCRNAFGPRIIQTCNLGFGAYPFQSALDQLEEDAVQMYLKQRNLPSSDASLIYIYGRADLRDEIRGNMLAILTALIARTSGRTPHEQTLYNWIQGLVQANEIKRLQEAIAEFRNWQRNICTYTLDADLAREYGLSYNGRQACLPQSQVAFGAPLVPAASYFQAYGMKQSFGKPAATEPRFADMIANSMTNRTTALGIATGVAAGSALIGGATVAALVSSGSFFVYTTTAPVVGIAAGSSALGIAAIVFICVVVGVIATIAISDNENQLRELNGMTAQLTLAQSTAPNLPDYLTDPTGLGTYKIAASLTALTLPNPSSTATLPTRGTNDAVFEITPSGGLPAIQTELRYSDWAKDDWSVETTGGWLRQTLLSTSECRTDPKRPCKQNEAFNGTMRFVDWAGNNMVAYRMGNLFGIGKAVPVSTDVRCSPSAETGLTVAADLSKCIGYVTDRLQYRSRGSLFTARLTTAPFFSSSATVNFTRNGAATDFAIAAGGFPLPDVTLDPSSAALPTGLTFTGSATLGKGVGRIRYAGSNATPAGSYTVVVRATGPNANRTQSITVNVYADLRITSASSFSVNYGRPESILLEAVGQPPLTMTMDSAVLLSGYTFTDLGNGRGRLTGTTFVPPGMIFAGICVVQPSGPPRCPGLTVSGPQGSVTQQFSMSVRSVPKPSLTATSALFQAGESNRVRVGSQGGEIASRFVIGLDKPSWLTMTDNGDGTADLSGTPPLNADPISVFLLDVFPVAGLFLGDPTPNFTLIVQVQPIFQSSNSAGFTVGQSGSFTIRTNQTAGVIRSVGALPAGLQFQDNGNGTATLIGTPQANSGGFYPLQLSMTSNTGTGTSPLYLAVNEPPTFKSLGSANFFVGQRGSYSVIVGGFPAGSSVLPPVQGMLFTVDGLPPSLGASNLTPQGITSGSLVISGTPTSADIGTRTLRITANNTIGTPAVQQFTLQIAGAPGDVNLDGAVNCADLQIVRAVMGTSVGMPNFDRRADLNNDWAVNILDLSAVSRRLPSGTSCPN